MQFWAKTILKPAAYRAWTPLGWHSLDRYVVASSFMAHGLGSYQEVDCQSLKSTPRISLPERAVHVGVNQGCGLDNQSSFNLRSDAQ